MTIEFLLEKKQKNRLFFIGENILMIFIVILIIKSIDKKCS
jgi:hypothetical protein